MSEYKEAQLLAFRDELKKLAFPTQALGSAGALGGIGAGAGAAIGAGISGVRNYRQAREQGATRGQALGAGFGGAVGGATKGALVGGATGLVGGGIAHALAPTQMEALRKNLTDRSSFARFGQRQVHGITGYTPAEGLSSLRMGASERAKAVDHAQKSLERAHAGADERGWTDKLLQRTPQEAAQKQLDRATNAHRAAQVAEEKGLTSLPGYAKRIRQEGLWRTAGYALDDQFAGTSMPMKAFTIGAPAMQLRAAYKQDPDETNAMGQTRGEALGEAAAGLGTGLLMSPLPMGTQMLAAAPLMYAGRRIGRALGHKPQPEQVGGLT